MPVVSRICSMNAIVVEEYGGVDKLITKQVPKPKAEGNDILVR